MRLLRVILRVFFPRTRRKRPVVIRRPRPVRHDREPPLIEPSGSAHPQTLAPADWVTPIASEQHLVTVKGRCYVIDGDTIAIGNTRLRLAGIDAPELGDPYGDKAKWAMIRMCKGQTIRAVLEGEMSYDRTVATCYLPDGRDLSAEMVKLGLAVDWPKFSGGKYAQFETPGLRRRLWRCDARQKGKLPPQIPD